MIFLFGWAKQIIFISQKSLFDWYYWVPQLLLFVPVLIFVLEQKERRNLWLSFACYILYLPNACLPDGSLYCDRKRRVELPQNNWYLLNQYEKDKNQWILLEPAGYVPYFSGLKTIDEVGLVDKQIQEEIKKIRSITGSTR